MAQSYNVAELNPNWNGGIYLDSKGYVRVRRVGHQRADRRGYVLRSILAWEKANDKPFPEGKYPHHDNEIKDDDISENILPLTHSEHTKIHKKNRLQKRDTKGRFQ